MAHFYLYKRGGDTVFGRAVFWSTFVDKVSFSQCWSGVCASAHVVTNFLESTNISERRSSIGVANVDTCF